MRVTVTHIILPQNKGTKGMFSFCCEVAFEAIWFPVDPTSITDSRTLNIMASLTCGAFRGTKAAKHQSGKVRTFRGLWVWNTLLSSDATFAKLCFKVHRHPSLKNMFAFAPETRPRIPL